MGCSYSETTTTANLGASDFTLSLSYNLMPPKALTPCNKVFYHPDLTKMTLSSTIRSADRRPKKRKGDSGPTILRMIRLNI